MSEQQIEVKAITTEPELKLYECLARLINEKDAMSRLALVDIASDAFEEFKLQNIKNQS